MTTTNKSLAQPSYNDPNWDVPLNANFGILDAALGGMTSINITGTGTSPVTLTSTQYKNLIIQFTGTLSSDVRYNVPSGVGGQWVFWNNTTGAYFVTIGSLGGGTTVSLASGSKTLLTSDGTGIFYSDDQRASPGGSTTQIQYNNAGVFAGSSSLTYSGGNLNLTAGSFNGDNNRSLNMRDNGGTLYQVLNVDGSNNLQIGSTNFTGKISFYNNGAEHGYFGTNGNFNVGANGVVVNTKFSMTHDGSNAALSNITGNTLFYSPSSYVWHISGNQLAFLDVSGNFDVGSGDQSSSGLYNCISTLGYFCRSGYSGSFDGAAFNIHWTGSAAELWIGSNNAGIISTTSDRRIKENITSLSGNAIAQIMALRPVTYTHKNIDIWRPGGEKVGFVADELAEQIPQAVVGAPDAVDKDGNIIAQNIDSIAILATVVKAFQELKSDFDAYKAAHP